MQAAVIKNTLRKYQAWSFIVLFAASPIYLGGYAVVRKTNTWYWFDKQAEVRTNYTLFDEYSRIDTLLFVGYYPVCVVDRWLTGRHFERDKF